MTKETIEQVLKFRDERNWKQFHNPKDLAISICLEAAELLEVFQWSADEVWCEEKKKRGGNYRLSLRDKGGSAPEDEPQSPRPGTLPASFPAAAPDQAAGWGNESVWPAAPEDAGPSPPPAAG